MVALSYASLDLRPSRLLKPFDTFHWIFATFYTRLLCRIGLLAGDILAAILFGINFCLAREKLMKSRFAVTSSARLAVSALAGIQLLAQIVANAAPSNTANGLGALYSNTTGFDNTANGFYALYSNITGIWNVANGMQSLQYNTTGTGNVAEGTGALIYNITGSYNIAIGNSAGALVRGSSNIDIGNLGYSSDNGVIRIGTTGTPDGNLGSQTSTYIAGISGVNVDGGVAVYINSNGQLGTITSSRRFKNDIKDMGDVTDKLMQLRPVTFKYKDSADIKTVLRRVSTTNSTA